jgi:hypothetical protein
MAIESTQDWANVYAHAEQTRVAWGWTKEHVYDRATISEPVYNGMRTGRPIRRKDKLAGLRRAFRWDVATLDALLAGQQVPVGPVEDERTDAATTAQVNSLRADLHAERAARRSEAQELRDQVEELVDQVGVLTAAVDELRGGGRGTRAPANG